MQNMKKLLALVLVIAMVAALFVGCQPTDEPNDSKDTTPATGSATPATGDTTPATGDTTPATGDTTEPAVPGEYEGYVASSMRTANMSAATTTKSALPFSATSRL